MYKSEVEKSLKVLSDDELIEKYVSNYYDDSVKDLALSEIKSSGLQIPEVFIKKEKDSFLKKHPFISLVIIGLSAKIVMEIVKRITY